MAYKNYSLNHNHNKRQEELDIVTSSNYSVSVSLLATDSPNFIL